MAGFVCEGFPNTVPQLGGFISRGVLSQFRRPEYEIKVSAGLVPSADWEEGSVLGLSPCLEMTVFSVSRSSSFCEYLCIQTSSFYKDTVIWK